MLWGLPVSTVEGETVNCDMPYTPVLPNLIMEAENNGCETW